MRSEMLLSVMIEQMSLESAEMVMQEVISYNWMKETMQKKNKEQILDKNKNKKSQLLKKAKEGIVPAAVSSLITVVATLLITNISNMRENINKIPEFITTQSKMLEEIEELKKNTLTQEEITELKSDISGLQEDVKEINRDLGRVEGAVIQSDNSLKELLMTTYSSDNTVYESADLQIWSDQNEKIASDVKTGKPYRVMDLVNIPIITSYTDENGEEVFFMGQYDDTNHWNGHCVINRYKDNKLTFIMEAEYDSGKLLQYKQVFPFEGNEHTWMISDRTVEKASNQGETYSYFWKEAPEKTFDIQTVNAENILDTEAFQNIMELQLEGYYSGYTTDGFFNDETGKAYLIKYDKHGYVRTLYVGKFKNGEFEDETNEAWYIVKNENTDYMYYKGQFKEGQPSSNIGSIFISPPLTKEKRSEILEGTTFETLPWMDPAGI